jgi:cytidyltransferase-like protein|tara:strand:+ start:6008 stop:6778 length:771 start_codon:yes stop_codon:yes gene_type:complete
MERIVLVTGGFDPLHSGHIDLFNEAKKLGDTLIVGVNTDEWLTRKKGRPFMPFEERHAIVSNLKMVDDTVSWDDSDDSACGAIFKLMCTKAHNKKIIFANGGDRDKDNIPELKLYGDVPQVEFAFGVGGDFKKNSSSWILQEWKEPKTERQWGYYRVLHEYGPHVKVKELTVDPGKKLSMQRHEQRAEHWFVSEGEASVYGLDVSTDITLTRYKKHKSLHIPRRQWHMLANETDKPLKVVEIQYGENCVEEDIERR